MLLEIDATATISTFPSSLNGFDFASLSSLNFVGRNPVFPELRTEKVMTAPTDQQGLEQLRNASIKLAERWQREAVAKVTPAVKWGTRPGSRSHQTEFFRPILSVMKAKTLTTPSALSTQPTSASLPGCRVWTRESRRTGQSALRPETSTSIAPPPVRSCNASPSVASRNPQSAPEPISQKPVRHGRQVFRVFLDDLAKTAYHL